VKISDTLTLPCSFGFPSKPSPNDGRRKKAARARKKLRGQRESQQQRLRQQEMKRDQRDMLQYVEKGMAVHGPGWAVCMQVCGGEVVQDFLLPFGPVNADYFV
jgi:hypothetical protein